VSVAASLSALSYGLCKSGAVLLSAWWEVVERSREAGPLGIRHMLGVRKAIVLHAGPCDKCHDAVERWGGWNRLENALNPLPPQPDMAEPEE
jgi:hypothetical protein